MALFLHHAFVCCQQQQFDTKLQPLTLRALNASRPPNVLDVKSGLYRTCSVNDYAQDVTISTPGRA